MNEVGMAGGWLRSTALLALLAACGGGATAVKPAPATPRSEAPAPAPAEPSAFEQRWAEACSADGAVGQCPAPFDRPAVFVDVGASEHAAPPFCGALESPAGDEARAALGKKRRALAACFRGSEPGSYVELGPDAAVVSHSARASAARTESCVAKLVKRTLGKLGGPPPERIVVLRSASARPGEQVLSKASLDEVIAAHATEVNACYDAALEAWPGLSGRIASSFVIWFDGRVALVRTGQSSLHNPALECCINTAIRGWTFPKPSDGSIALVTLPFSLGQ